MTRDRLLVCTRWLAASTLLAACGDDGAAVVDTGSGSSESSGATSIGVDTTAAVETTTSAGTTAADTTAAHSTSEGSSGSTSAPATESGSESSSMTCGNDVLEGDEVCDGAALDGHTCESEGFPGGTLGCAPDCSALDTSNCATHVCGNATIEEGEDCEGADFGGLDCVALDFDAGVLACAPDCTFDTSSCVTYSCGDGLVTGREQCDGDSIGGALCSDLGYGDGTVGCTDNCQLDYTACCGDDHTAGTEVCDGTDVGASTCASAGFDGGVIACAADCTALDTSACFVCGDGQIGGAESCDGDDLGGSGCADVGFVAGALGCAADCTFDTSACTMCGNDAIDPGEACDGSDLGGSTCLDLGFTGGAVVCAAACDFDTSGCTNLPLPGADDLVITEVMQNPNVLTDDVGEWFEIHNPSNVTTYQLHGCTIEGSSANDSFAIDVDLEIGPGAYLTFATDAAPGFTPDFVWGGSFALNNSSDTVRLVCNTVTVDEVVYDDGATFPDPTGASMSLDPTATTALANDDGSNWCEGQTPYNGADLGTPGVANPSCAPPVYTVDYCNVQFPTTIDALEGSSATVYGRLFIAGLTDLNAINDPAVNVTGWVGVGPDGSDPASAPGWTWTMAAPNPAWLGVGFPDQNNDEYQADIVLPAVGSYDYAFRFTGDGGGTFTYCDTGNGSTDGYAAADAGQMTTQPAGSPSALYFSEYHEGTGTFKALEIYNPTNVSVNTGSCEIRQYFNGAGTSTNIALTGGLVAPHGVYTICTTAFTPAIYPAGCTQVTGLLYNGDDAVQLWCNGASVDVIGQIGVDPGSEWNANGVGTMDEDIRRLCTVTAGDPDGSDAFDPSAQWQTFPLTNLGYEISNLGQYTCP